MTKNIVVGALRFLGFHICESLLEKGQEVIGLDWEVELIQDYEEKELLFGRNSNFTLLTNTKPIMDVESCHIYVCMYDYLMDGNRGSIPLLLESLRQITSQSLLEPFRIYMFFPQTIPNDINEEVENWKKSLKKNTLVKSIFLSSIYGPWLPSTSPIQKMMLGEKMAIDMSRYMYIDDLIIQMDKIINQNSVSVSVRPPYNKDWREQTTSFFDIDVCEETSDETDENAMIIPTKTSLIEGLQLVKEHNKKLQFIQQWKEK